MLMFLLLFLIIFISIYFFSHREPFSNRDTVILMGDSIYENSKYVPLNDSVYNQLKEKHKNTHIVAKDSSEVRDLNSQFIEAEKYIKGDKPYLFISIGGNDILKKHNIMKNNMKKHLNDLFNSYKNILSNNKNKYNIVLTTIYKPYLKKYRKYDKNIEYWNNRIKELSVGEGYAIFNIHNIVYKHDHFVMEIEPSSKSSKLIAEGIINKLRS